MTQKTSGPFSLSTSYNGQWCIQGDNFTREQHWYLHRAVMANHMDDIFYTNKRGANPFFQGGSDLEEGFALIEFWCSGDENGKRIAQTYIDFLNEHFEAEVKQAREWGCFDKL